MTYKEMSELSKEDLDNVQRQFKNIVQEEMKKLIELSNTNIGDILQEKINRLEQENFKKDKTIKQLQEQSKALDKQAQEYFEAVLFRDKVIDLIARMLNRNDIDEDICRQMGVNKDCNEYDDEENCINCIKEYFYKKVQK